MKKTTILFMLTAIVACNKNVNQETKNTKVLWAESVLTILPLERDSLWTEEEWKTVYKYDKEKIVASITDAVLSGKLKAYADYPGTAYTVNEATDILGELSSDDIIQLKFNEKIELDTVSFTLNKEVLYITFFSKKQNEAGEVIGLKKLLDVGLNTVSDIQKEK